MTILRILAFTLVIIAVYKLGYSRGYWEGYKHGEVDFSNEYIPEDVLEQNEGNNL